MPLEINAKLFSSPCIINQCSNWSASAMRGMEVWISLVAGAGWSWGWSPAQLKIETLWYCMLEKFSESAQCLPSYLMRLTRCECDESLVSTYIHIRLSSHTVCPLCLTHQKWYVSLNFESTKDSNFYLQSLTIWCLCILTEKIIISIHCISFHSLGCYKIIVITFISTFFLSPWLISLILTVCPSLLGIRMGLCCVHTNILSDLIWTQCPGRVWLWVLAWHA